MSSFLGTGALLTGAKLVNSGVGLLFILSLALILGASGETDALFAAMILPVNIWQTTQGMISQVAVPYTAGQGVDSADSADFRRLLFSTLILVGLAVSAVVFATSEAILSVMTPGLDATAKAQATSLLCLLAPIFLLTLVSGHLQSTLLARKAFLRAELGQIVWKAAPVVTLFNCWHDVVLEHLARGLVIGAVLRVLVLLTGLRRNEIADLRPMLPKISRFPDYSRRLACTEFVIYGSSWGLELLFRMLLSTLPAGGFTIYSYADRLARTIPIQMAQGFGLVLLPDLSRVAASDEDGGYSYMKRFLKVGLALGAGTGLVLYLGSGPMTWFFSLAGKIGPEDLDSLKYAIQGFCLGIPVLVVLMFLQGYFLIKTNTLFLLLADVLQILCYVAAYFLLRPQDPWVFSVIFSLGLLVKLLYFLFIFKRFGKEQLRR